MAVTGVQLRQIRHRLGLTQATFAPRLGITANSLARLERGDRRVSETLALLVRVLASQAPGRRRNRRR
jgi:transcriptional regulator with XRE-family HTH domain